MKILLTGGAGFIGSHTAVELLQRDFEVVIVDNFVNSDPSVLDRIKKISGVAPAFYECDVCDRESLARVFDAESPDAVIHFAGLKAVGESVGIPLRYYRNNLDSTLTLLEVMKEHSVNALIFSSSATVYGDPASVPITEDMPTGRCSNPYGQTKFFIEQIIRDASAADNALSAILLRYFNPIGAHKSGLIYENPRGIPNNLMPYIIRVADGILPQLNIFGNDYPTPDGTGVRDYIHVVDLALGHVAALEYALSHTGTEVFNLGTGNGSSVLDVVKTFERVNGVPVKYSIGPRRSGDIAECYADASKAKNKLGWTAKLTLEDMCRDGWHAQCLAKQ